MRRSMMVVLVAGSLALAGCEGLKDAFSPQANLVASAAGQKLETDRLVGLLGKVPGGQVPPDGIAFLAGLWVDLDLFTQARISGSLASDSGAFHRIMWPQILQARIQAWQDTLQARRPQPTEASADSAYAAGEARVFQHIIVTPAGAKASDTAAARTRIAGLLAQIRRGGDFGTVAGTTNADASRQDQGYLPVGPKGQFVPEFENAAWALEPGQVSEVVQSPFGFHLIRRPAATEARARFLSYLGQSGRQRGDSVYITNLAKDYELKVVADAGKKLKTAVGDLEAARKNSTRLATYQGGGFSVKDFARWMEALPPGAARQIESQPDSVLGNFVEGLAQNALVVRQMDSAGLKLPEAESQALQLAYRATTDQLASAIGLSDGFVADTSKPVQERLDSAFVKVDIFIEQLMAGQAQFRPIPGSLTGYLRETGKYRINRAGLTRATELVVAKQKADSAANAAQAPAQPGPVQPAPGGPPVTPPAGGEPPKP
jgi:hypothetical protein